MKRQHPSSTVTPIHLLLALVAGLIVFGALPLKQPIPARAQADDDPGDEFFGINFVNPSEPWLSLAREAGARVVRWQFNWRDHEPSPGVWEWEISDGQIEAWRGAGLEVHAILHFPPDYAMAHPGGLMPVNFDLPWNDPNNGWAQYCNHFAAHYRGQIASYEVWNEPDLDQYWEGTAPEYYDLLKSCYQGIKAADPAVPVSMAGVVLIADRGFFPEVVRLAASDPAGPAHNYFFDAASIHMYADPDLAYSLTNEARRILRNYGLGDKPIWITETNVMIRGYATVPDDAGWGRATEDEAAWYILQAATNAYAAGAERFMVFRMADDGMTEAYGLVRSDGTPRPSYEAFKLAATLLTNIVEAERQVWGDVIITRMRRADGTRIVTAYQVSGTPLNIQLDSETDLAVLINSAGGYSTVEPERGVYTVLLPPAQGRDFNNVTNYSVGGPIQILVEYDNQAPTVALQSQEVPGSESAVAISWQGDDGEFGTGVVSYDVEVSRDGGPWEPWLAETVEEGAVYQMPTDGDYTFQARAVDRSGNVGPFSPPLTVSLRPLGTLVAQVLDLRGQPVPFARVELADGTLHDADADGLIRVELEPGTVAFTLVDGSAHGQLIPPPVEIAEDQQTTVTWTLLPTQNLIADGTFSDGLGDWLPSSPADVGVHGTATGNVLRLSGHRRPWGAPAASLSVTVPQEMSGGLLSFDYRLPEGGQALRLRAVTLGAGVTLWQSDGAAADFTSVQVDMARFAGREVTLVFDLAGTRDAPPTSVEIDNVFYGNVPIVEGE
jgi:hypothetical protein